jgi:hypothetical protein
MNKQISIPLNFILQVKQEVVRKLNCKDDFELHKKFEGLEFYKKNLKKLTGLFFTEKMFNINLINKNDVLVYKDEFVINEEKYKVVVIDLEEKIKIEIKEEKTYIFFLVFNDFRYIKHLSTIKSKNLTKSELTINDLK